MITNRKLSNISQAIETTIAVLLFVIGGSIYIAFRTTSLRMFGWFDSLGFHEFITAIRNATNNIQVPEMVIFCIPDGLWTLSYILFMDVIWAPDKRRQIIFCSIIPFIGATSEILQYFNVIEGTFDIIDLLCYTIPFVIYLILKVKV